MTAIVDAFISRMTADRVAYITAGTDDWDIFEPKFGSLGFDYAPRCMYLYYVRVNTNGKLKVTHFDEIHNDDPLYPDDPKKKWKELPRDKAGLEDFIKDFADNARTKDPIKPKPSGKNFEAVRWKHRSIIAIIFDEKHLKLYKKHTDGTSIVFVTKKGNANYTPNHTFADAVDLDIEFANGDIRPAIAFINHMRDANGNVLQNEEHYQFNILLRGEFEDLGAGGVASSPIDIIIDPGGTNQGPPVEP